MFYGDIIAIGNVDVRHLNQPGKIVIETPLAAPSSLIAIGAGTAAALAAAGIVSTDTIAIGDGALALAGATALGNLAIGSSAFGAITTGDDNLRVGHDFTADDPLATGSHNVVIGNYDSAAGLGSDLAAVPAANSSRYLIIAGDTSIAVVDPVLESVHIGSGNPGQWRFATGVRNVTIGDEAAAFAGDGSRNVIIGRQAAVALTNADDSVIIGEHAAPSLTIADNQVVIGSGAAPVLTGGNNTIIGRGGAATLTSGVYDIVIGARNLGGAAPAGPTTSSYNVVIGPYDSVAGNQLAEIPAGATGSYVVVAGGQSIVVVDPALRNIHLGSTKPGNWRTAAGTDNSAIGDSSLLLLSTGLRNYAYGSDALRELTTGSDNVAIGYRAIRAGVGSAAASRNVAIGSFTLDSITSAVVDSVAIGYNAATAAISADGGIYLGSGAGPAVTTGDYNTLAGFGVAPTLATGDFNVVIGAYIAAVATAADVPAAASGGYIVIAAHTAGEASGDQIVVVTPTNVFIGPDRPGNWLTSSGGDNVAVGHQALNALTTGGDNVAIGAFVAGSLTTGSHNILIGNTSHAADTPAVGTSDMLVVGNVIFGNLAAGDIRIGGTNAVIGSGIRFAVFDDHDDSTPVTSTELTGANGTIIRNFVGTRNPDATVSGDPGDIYFRKSGVNSMPFVNIGAAAANTIWQSLGGGQLQTVTVLTGAGNHTVSNKTRLVVVVGVGAGGGGGGAEGNAAGAASGGGGGAGAQGVAVFVAAPSATYAYSAGAKGTGGAAGNNNGNNGADTVFDSGAVSGATYTWPGGKGGSGGANANPQFILGGAISSSPTLTGGLAGSGGPGASGGFGFRANSAAQQGLGGGGASAPDWGAGGAARTSTGGGNAATGFGAGGGGGTQVTTAAGQTGGDGADGKLVVYEYT